MVGMALMMHLVLAEAGADVVVGTLLVVLVMVRMTILGVEAAILGLWAAVERKRHDTMLYCQIVERCCQAVEMDCQALRLSCLVVWMHY